MIEKSSNNEIWIKKKEDSFIDLKCLVLLFILWVLFIKWNGENWKKKKPL